MTDVIALATSRLVGLLLDLLMFSNWSGNMTAYLGIPDVTKSVGACYFSSRMMLRGCLEKHFGSILVGMFCELGTMTMLALLLLHNRRQVLSTVPKAKTFCDLAAQHKICRAKLRVLIARAKP